MSTTAVGHCEQCAAVVNRRWARCLVCHAPLPPAPLPLPYKAPAVQLGERITWVRGDGSVQTGTVDFVHVDVDGIAWAFVTIGETWAVWNVKFTKRI